MASKTGPSKTGASKTVGRFSIRGNNPSPLSKSVTVKKSKSRSPPKNKIPTPPRISPLLNKPRAQITMRLRPYGVDRTKHDKKYLYRETMPTLLVNRGIPIQVMKLGLDRHGWLIVEKIYDINNKKHEIYDEDELLTYKQIEANNQKLIKEYKQLEEEYIQQHPSKGGMKPKRTLKRRQRKSYSKRH
jgi:hypothetical protein